jgi:hypothetical protein
MTFEHMSFWANVFLGKRLLGNYLSGQMSFCANVIWANVHLGKCLSGQMSSGQMSIWPNVTGQMSMGKPHMGKCRITQQHISYSSFMSPAPLGQIGRKQEPVIKT